MTRGRRSGDSRPEPLSAYIRRTNGRPEVPWGAIANSVADLEDALDDAYTYIEGRGLYAGAEAAEWLADHPRPGVR